MVLIRFYLLIRCFSKEKNNFIGEKENLIRLGDEVKVQVKETDIERRTIDLIFDEKEKYDYCFTNQFSH